MDGSGSKLLIEDDAYVLYSVTNFCKSLFNWSVFLSVFEPFLSKLFFLRLHTESFPQKASTIEPHSSDDDFSKK